MVEPGQLFLIDGDIYIVCRVELGCDHTFCVNDGMEWGSKLNLCLSTVSEAERLIHESMLRPTSTPRWIGFCNMEITDRSDC